MVTAVRAFALLIFLATLQGGDDGSRPTPDESPYLDVPAWFEKLPMESSMELAPAAVVAAVAPASPAFAAGVAVGDRLLALDGRRLHDQHELRLLRSALSLGHDQETWTVMRNAMRMTLTIAGLSTYGATGATLADAEHDPDLAALLARLGSAVPDADAQDLHLLPGRIRHAFGAWLAAHPEVTSLADAPWLAAWATTHLQVLRGEPVAPPGAPIPDDFLARVDHFHRAIASAHAAGQIANDPQALGCDRWFFALFYPFPPGTAPAFGTPLVNPGLAEMLRRHLLDPVDSYLARNNFAILAMRIVDKEDGIARYLAQITATLTDPRHFEGWLQVEASGWDAATRNALLAELRARFDAHGEDADLAGCALCTALVSAGKSEEALAITVDMFTRSPYVAWRARNMAWSQAINLNRRDDARLIKAYGDGHPYSHLPPYPEIYDYLLMRNRILWNLCCTMHCDPLHGVPMIMRTLPDLVASSLGQDAGVRDDSRQDIIDSFEQLNESAWTIATHAPWTDRDQAAIFAHMLMSIGGGDMNINQMDTIAACFARAGDFANALRLEQEALDGSRPFLKQQYDSFAARVALYKGHAPATEPSEPTPGIVESVKTWPGGGKKAVGQLLNSERIGTWRFYSGKGALVGLCGYRGGQPDGACLTFHANGNRAIEGFLIGGEKRIGRWRTWHENGNLASDGCYTFQDGKPLRTGEWIWYHASGQRRESGLLVKGRREGDWLAWGEDGALLSRTHFLHDRPDAAWAGTPLPPPEPPSPAPEPEWPKAIREALGDF